MPSAAGPGPGAIRRRGSKFDFVRLVKSAIYADRTLVLQTPLQASWQLTLKCNLSCDYCYAGCGPGHPRAETDRSRLLAIARELGRNRVFDVTLEGGEPFVCEHLFDVMAELKRYPVTIDVLTNGTLIDDHVAAELARILHRRNDTFQVSVDSIDTHGNDAHRGAGALEATLAGVSALVRAGFNVRTNSVVTARTVEALPELYSALARLGVNGGFSMAPLFFAGRGREVARPDRGRAVAARERLRALEAATPHLTVFGAMLPPDHGRLCGQDILGERLGACSGGRAKIAISPEGMVTPCVFYDEALFSFGTLPDTPLEALWHGEAARRYRAWARSQSCSGCRQSAQCSGVCVGMTLAQCPVTATAEALITGPSYDSRA